MGKRKVTTSSLPRLEAVSRPKLLEKPETQTATLFSKLWVWTAILLVIGIIIVSVVSLNAATLLKRVQIPGLGAQTPTAVPVTTLRVQRTALYNDLDVTVVNAQYAQFFSDDDIRPGQAMVRLNLQVANHTRNQINIIYYDIARLLGAGGNALSPTNVHLSVGPQPGKQESGWLDFSLPNKINALKTLTLQLGSMALNESTVKIPFTGAYDATQYANRTFSQSTTISYNFSGHTLTYHLISIETRLAYQGMQCKAGQQFYLLNFKVDNGESGDISPGYGFDYIRLVLPNDEHAPIDNSLPYTFKAGKNGVSGAVVFSAPHGMRKLTIGFLSQNGNGEQDTDITL